MMHKAVKDASPKLYKESFFIHRTDTRSHFAMLHICASLGVTRVYVLIKKRYNDSQLSIAFLVLNWYKLFKWKIESHN